VLPRLAREIGAEAVFCNRRYEPYAQARDNRVFNALNEARVGFEVLKDAVAWEDQELLTQAGRPFTVFTPTRAPGRQGRRRRPSHGCARRTGRIEDPV